MELSMVSQFTDALGMGVRSPIRGRILGGDTSKVSPLGATGTQESHAKLLREWNPVYSKIPRLFQGMSLLWSCLQRDEEPSGGVSFGENSLHSTPSGANIPDLSALLGFYQLHIHQYSPKFQLFWGLCPTPHHKTILISDSFLLPSSLTEWSSTNFWE